jgi:dipeptidyl aminopeptidase/acylaminoacyl peptidase
MQLVTSTMQIQNTASRSLADKNDLRSTRLWAEVSEYFEKLQGPAFGKISAVNELDLSPDQSEIAFTGSVWEKLEGTPTKRICILNIATKECTIITHGTYNDVYPRYSPDGKVIAFLSDRVQKGVSQLYLLRRDAFGEAVPTPKIDGSVEYLEWSPNGSKILLGIAGKDADTSDAGGSGKVVEDTDKNLPSWVPTIKGATKKGEWRRLALYDVETDKLSDLELSTNPWEAVWLGDSSLVAIVSKQPGEEAWYFSDPVMIDLDGAKANLRSIGRPGSPGSKQRGSLASSSDGKVFAFIESLASDRGLIAGDIIIGISASRTTQKLSLENVDVTFVKWLNNSHLYYAGLSGIGLVVGIIIIKDTTKHGFDYEQQELYRSSEATADGFYPSVTPLSFHSFVITLQSRTQYPEIVSVNKGKRLSIKSFEHDGVRWLNPKLGESNIISWKAPDGLEIEGILDLPSHGTKPYPLLLNVHGGPVYSWQNTWIGASYIGYLVSKGYAILSPNPRGSSGRGQAFMEKVLGDVGGAETQDHLSGIDALIEMGKVDPDRIGVIGGSHGGFMASWIVTQDPRFKATIPIAAVTDWHSQLVSSIDMCYHLLACRHFTSNISSFDQLFLRADPFEHTAKSPYLLRSPVMMAYKTKTPTLQIAGDQDLCVPISQAQLLHKALQETGTKNVLAIYPGQGHGIRTFPAIIDMIVRIVDWFTHWVPLERS